jgi:hypothetical protein
VADPWVLNGTSYTKAQLVQAIQTSITATDAATAAKVAATQAVASASTQRAQALKLRTLVLKLLELQLGDESPVLAQLGFTKVVPTPTVAAKSAALDKSKATREARHTMGSKQKAAIKGVVVATTAPSAAAATTPKVGS